MNADFLSRFEGAAHEVASWDASLLIQSTLMIAAGLTAAWLMKRRGAALQSCVLRATLVGVLASPFASWALRQAGVSGLQPQFAQTDSLEMNSRDEAVASDETVIVNETVSSATSAESQLTISPDRVPEESAVMGEEILPPSSLLTESDGSEMFEPEFSAPSLIGRDGAETHVTNPVESASGPAASLPSLLAILVSIWLAGSVLLFARLLVAYWKMSQLCRQAVAASSAGECIELAASMNLRVPKLLISPVLKSPCLFGWLRPAILLPDGSEPVSRDVLRHELSHLRRNDCCWNLLSVLIPRFLRLRLSSALSVLLVQAYRMPSTAESRDNSCSGIAAVSSTASVLTG